MMLTWSGLFLLALLVARNHGLSIPIETPMRFGEKTSSVFSIKEMTRQSRRAFLFHSAVISGATILSPMPSSAGDQDGLLSTSDVADLLRVVPTFTLVDPKGVPFMVVGEDAKVTGYFFTEFDEAKRILDLARTSADRALKEQKSELRQQRKRKNLPTMTKQQEDDEIGINPWTTARISTVTLDVAVTLVIKSVSSRNYFQVAPSNDDVEDALALTNQTDLPEGKVPLFYMANFTMNDKSPLYFRKSELVAAFKRLNPQSILPEIKVSELFSVLTEMVKPGGTDEELKSLVFVAPRESNVHAKECAKASKGETPFQLGQRIIVL